MRGPGILGSFVLLLLSVFFAHLLAPAVDAVRRRLRVGRRSRPLARAAAILICYGVLAGIATPAWVMIGARHYRSAFEVTAGTAVERLAANRRHLPQHPAALLVFDTLVGEMRRALDDVISARQKAAWLLVVPVIAFLLLNHAPAFRRSALRRLPHGHLQWRGEEYLRDVNSAMAGYVRAQVAAGAIVSVACAIGFSLLRVPYAMSLAAAAGVLELIPVIGPLTVVLIATGQAGHFWIPVALFLGGLRLAQDYAVYPRLVTRGMHLPSAAVVGAVWVGAAASGAAGVVLAIPAAGFLSVSYRHWREYREIERLVKWAERERLAIEERKKNAALAEAKEST